MKHNYRRLFCRLVESLAELIVFSVFDEALFLTFDRQVGTSLLLLLCYLHNHDKSVPLQEMLPNMIETGNIGQQTLRSVTRCIFEGVIGCTRGQGLAVGELTGKYSSSIEKSDLSRLLKFLSLIAGLK